MESTRTANPCDPGQPAAAATKRVVLVANKRWEADPVMGVLLEAKARPAALPWPHALNLRQPPPPKAGCIPAAQPRAVFRIGAADVELWCLQDIMNPDVSGSSSLEKAKVLAGGIFGSDRAKPDFVVALGTAAFPGAQSHNGCVVMGSGVFIHDPFEGDSDPAHWHDERTDRPLAPTLDAKFFAPVPTGIIDDSLRAETEARFLSPPIDPACARVLLAAYNYTSVGVVNIVNYDDYAWADPEALSAFEEKGQDPRKKAPVGSMETTHGLIRLQSEAPFLFISGITDRVGEFNFEVAPRNYTQNFVAAHNAGVAAAWVLPRIAQRLGS
jgi:hypothetical protein